MDTLLIFSFMGLLSICILIVIYFALKGSDEDTINQKLLDDYLNGSFSPLEIGTFYERYIGYLYEVEGYRVTYNGAVSEFSDLGRDLIAENDSEIRVIQAKCWADFKKIHEKHLFQLYGTTEHFRRTVANNKRRVIPVFYTSAKYTKISKSVAEVLDIELIHLELDKSYPLIKCNVSDNGEKIYHLPFDPYYDRVKIEAEKGEFFVHSVKEATAKGFRRAKNIPKKATGSTKNEHDN